MVKLPFGLRSRYVPLLTLSLFFVSLVSQALPPQIQVSADPSRSRNGESITYRIHIESDPSEPLTPPRIPIFSDWDIINNFQTRRLTSRLVNGQITSRSSWETNLVLKPLRRGKLKIPALSLSIGNKAYQTESIEVMVDSLGDGSTRRNRLHGSPGSGNPPGSPFPNLDPFADEESPEDLLSPSGPSANALPPSGIHDSDSHAQESFFIRAEPAKTNLYVGEMLLLSYAIFQRNLPLQNVEIGKFPEFKGFLKEDLLVPKIFSKTPIEVNGQMWQRSEIIRYALFPIQTGTLQIDPMVLRATIPAGANMADIIQNLLNGQPVPDTATEIPQSKSSKVLEIHVKALPPAPPGSTFTGGVGQFTLESTLSSQHVSVDQPFTITLKIVGFGNVQALEESPLKLPPEIESYQSKHQHRFAQDGSGEAVFEYLLMPRKSGDYTIPPIELTYFDPKTAQYKTLQTDSFAISATGGATGSSAPKAEGAAPVVAAQFSFPALDSGRLERVEDLNKISQGFTNLALWSVLLLFYFGAAVMYAGQRRRLSQSQFLSASPWKKTEKRLLAKRDWSASEIAEMLDEWMRLRLTSLCRQQDIDPGSPREAYIDDLRAQMAPENFSLLGDLKNLWSDLDLWRFSGNRSAATERQKSQDWLGKVEKLVIKLDKARFRKESDGL